MTHLTPTLLACHPDAPGAAVRSLEVGASLAGRILALTYRLQADLQGLCIPRLGPIARGDRLWEHTCFEAFLQPEGAEGYVELNLAPSGAWAAYGFDGYRAGMQALEVEAPDIRMKVGPDALSLQARIHLDALPGFTSARALRLGLCAVVEEAGGQRSYWALAHPAGKPDFHAPAGFAAELRLEGTP